MKYSAPTYVALELTGDCNLKCRHCYGNFPRKSQHELTTSEVFSIIDQLYKFGVFRIELGGGEPALRPDFLEIISYAMQFQDIDLTIVTNGIPWTEEMIYNLSKMKGNHINIHVSMDGYDPDSYSILRRNKDAFYKAVETSKLMLKYGLNVRWNYGVGKLTFPYLNKTLELAKDIRIPIIRFMVLYNTGRATLEDEMGFTYDEFQAFLIDYIENIIPESPVNISLALTQPFEFFVPLLEAGYSKDEIIKRIPNAISSLNDPVYKNQTNLGCTGGRMLSAITAVGEMHFCCILTSVPEFSGGNIFKNSIDDIWDNSDMFKWIRALKLEDLEANCMECQYRELCGGGCRARAYFSTNNFLAPDPLCPFVQKVKKSQMSIPFFEDNLVFSEHREVQLLSSSRVFSMSLNDISIRVRPEEFGALVFSQNTGKYSNINSSGFEILNLLHEFDHDQTRVINYLVGKYKMPNETIQERLYDFLQRFTNFIQNS